MTTFRFNFSGDEEIKSTDEPGEEIQWLESEEVLPGKQIVELDEIAVQAKMFTCNDVEIGHLLLSNVIASIDDIGLKNAIELSEKEHSDLVAGKYEGGLKIWECTEDFIQYLSESSDTDDLKDTKVLDLGCGAGILGIYAFMKGASVTFQDYNKEVLELITIPNVLLNIEDEERETNVKKCKFYSGDWASFNKLLPDTETFNYIFTCETIYNDCNYEKLISLFLKRLTTGGTVYVAAKTYYFGVGGGTRQFEKCIEINGSLKSEVCWKSTGGIQREILKITRKS